MLFKIYEMSQDGTAFVKMLGTVDALDLAAAVTYTKENFKVPFRIKGDGKQAVEIYENDGEWDEEKLRQELSKV